MTANAFAEDKIKSEEAGMNEHIAKSIDYEASGEHHCTISTLG